MQVSAISNDDDLQEGSSKSTAPIVNKVTDKMREREQYLQEVREADEADESDEEAGLDIIMDADDDNGPQIAEPAPSNKGKRESGDETFGKLPRENKKRRQPMDPFTGTWIE